MPKLQQGGLSPIVLLLSTLVVLLSCTIAQGEVVSWINPNGGSWGDAANWNTSRVPTGNDTVFIVALHPNATNYLNVTLNNQSFTVGVLYIGTKDGLGIDSKQPIGIFGPGTLTITTLFCGAALLNLNVVSSFSLLTTTALGCYLSNTNLTVNGKGLIQYMMVDGYVNITNNGLLNMGSRGIWYSTDDSNVTANVINRGTFGISLYPSSYFVLINANVDNYGTFNCRQQTIVSGTFTNYPGGNVTISNSLFTAGGQGYIQKGGTSFFLSPLQTVTAKLFRIEAGTVSISTSPYSTFGITFAGSFENVGGHLIIDAQGTPCSFSTFTQSPQGSLDLTYHLPTSSWYYGMFVSYLGVKKPVTVCDIQGTLNLHYVNDDLWVGSFPGFRSMVSALVCSVNYENQSSIAFSKLTLTQPTIGTASVVSSNRFVGLVTLYNITVLLTSYSPSFAGSTYLVSASISENSVPLPDVTLNVSLSNTHGDPTLGTPQVTTNYLGQVSIYTNFPADASFVSYDIQASIDQCVNTDSSTCTVSTSTSYTGTPSGDGSDDWIADNWWIWVAAGSGTAGALLFFIIAFRMYLRRLHHQHYVYQPVNYSQTVHHGWQQGPPPKQYGAYN